ncbi:hypothetical protein B0H14DRAFT_2758948 [Mycena olivaceomarginata]|nr:hypothetical protein B0H14DRAFT_2758948 [Mycena olivaceomarginata]
MIPPHPDGSSPPPYKGQDDSGSYRSGSDSVLSSKKPVSGPRYVYYRVYAPDGMLACKKHDQSHFIGHIKATSVPPPHTVASLKRALVQAEELPDPDGDLTQLFEMTDAGTEMVPSARVNIMNGSLGATPQTPVALVFLINPDTPLQLPGNYEGDASHMLYYWLYNRGGEETSIRSFDTSEPALGHVERESVAPPRNAISVKRRIARLEGKPIYRLADLFTDVMAETAHPSASLLDPICGSSMENPLMIVPPERRAGGVINFKPLLEGIYTVTNSRHFVVMELSDGNSWNGTVVQAYENAPVTTKHLFNQLWLVRLTSSGYYSFRNLRGGTYMELRGGNAANDTKIVGFEVQGIDGGTSINQEWEIIQAGEFYKIRNRNSKTYVKLKDGRSGNGTPIVGFADTAGTSAEQDELWQFTLRSVTVSDVHTVLERSAQRIDDMHVVYKNRILYVPPAALLAHLWRETPLVSMFRKSVFSDQYQMGLAFKTAVAMWAAEHIKADDISVLFGLVCQEDNGEACNWTLNEDHSSMLFVSPMDGSVVKYVNDHSWGFF